MTVPELILQSLVQADAAALREECARLRAELEALKTERGYLFREVYELQAELAALRAGGDRVQHTGGVK